MILNLNTKTVEQINTENNLKINTVNNQRDQYRKESKKSTQKKSKVIEKRKRLVKASKLCGANNYYNRFIHSKAFVFSCCSTLIGILHRVNSL